MTDWLKKTVFIIGLLVWSMVAVPSLFAADSNTGSLQTDETMQPASAAKDRVSKLIRKHLAMEEYYEKKAKEEEDLIVAHEKEKKEFYHEYYINEKITPKFHLRPMVRHCDIIIHEARKMRKQFLMFAHWHKMRAEELQHK